MGIFSFFSRDTEEDQDELTLEQEQPSTLIIGRQTETAPTGELFPGMRIDAMTKEGEPLLSGRIIELDGESLTLGRLPGELSFKIAPIDSTVRLSGYDKKLIPISLSASVETSSRTALSRCSKSMPEYSSRSIR